MADSIRERGVRILANAGGVNPMACAREAVRLASIRSRILSTNAYIGAFPLAEGLATGADVAIAGRSTDAALTLAPMVHRFHWQPTDYDRLAAGTIAGHNRGMRRAGDRR